MKPQQAMLERKNMDSRQTGATAKTNYHSSGGVDMCGYFLFFGEVGLVSSHYNMQSNPEMSILWRTDTHIFSLNYGIWDIDMIT